MAFLTSIVVVSPIPLFMVEIFDIEDVGLGASVGVFVVFAHRHALG